MLAVREAEGREEFYIPHSLGFLLGFSCYFTLVCFGYALGVGLNLELTHANKQ